MEEILPEDKLQSLRNLKIISENEIAYKKGDLIVVENVLTNEKRIVNMPDLTTEMHRRILKG
jgi:hypothetical protein